MTIKIKKVAAKKDGVLAATPPKRTIRKVNTEHIQDVFVDGMSSLNAGAAVSKISFYTTVSASETEDVRRVSLRLVMETDVMIDIVTKLSKSILKNSDKLNGSLEQHKNETLSLVDKLRDN